MHLTPPATLKSDLSLTYKHTLYTVSSSCCTGQLGQRISDEMRLLVKSRNEKFWKHRGQNSCVNSKRFRGRTFST